MEDWHGQDDGATSGGPPGVDKDFGLPPAALGGGHLNVLEVPKPESPRRKP